MDTEHIREYCLKKRGVTESFPFDEDTLVFKVISKIFCLANLIPPHSINLKCDPEKAIELREKYHAVQPGYHMNKTHWNTIELDGSIRKGEIEKWIDHSYELVKNSLTKKEKLKLNEM
ncbi:MAG: MmcQ-like protein [Ignavibacteria bacterium RBG_13_36_8]|nr:MAG: MmcQ-like protein [Ignavibacteria bacterium RBG_13_36_8]